MAGIAVMFNKDGDYPEEAVLRIETFTGPVEIRTDAGEVGDKVFGCEYVRITDNGEEVGYWDHREFEDDPKNVLGAIFGTLAGIRVAEGDEPFRAPDDEPINKDA